MLRSKIVVPALFVTLGIVAWRRAAPNSPAKPPPTPSPTIALATERAPLGATRPRAASAVPTWTRREIVEHVAALYRKEQLTRELELEQRRFGRNYWDAEGDGRELAALRLEKDAMLAQLGTEAGETLRALLSDGAGQPIALSPLFDADHPAPHIAFLAAPARERLIAAILAEGGEHVDAERWMAIAEQVLSPVEFGLYRQWNEPSAAALREQLAGFNPNEFEFVAILRRPHEASDAALAAQLGAARLREFQQLQDPATQTARRELRRLGLPLENAEWLAAARTRATAAIAEVWRDADLPPAAKSIQVAQLDRAWGEAIAAQLNLPPGSLDEITGLHSLMIPR